MRRTVFIMALACAGVVAAVIAQPGTAGQPTLVPPGAGLTVKDFIRVEQVRGDAGGLSKSLARGPATVSTPNDFAGVYQIPEDADSPYAGWYARVQGAVIAVFPRGEYSGGTATIPANTRFFLGGVPRNMPGATKPRVRTVEAANERIDNNAQTAPGLPPLKLSPDAPMPVTVDTATDLAGVQGAMAKLCGDVVYRANRVRELVERAGGSGK